MSAPRRALVVIDAQLEYFDGLLPIQHPDRDTSIGNIAAAIDTAHEHDLAVVVVQHASRAGSPVFAPDAPTFALHPRVAERVTDGDHRITKSYASVFEHTGLVDWMREHDIDIVTLTGYMTNNCVLGSAADAEPLGFSIEVLSDATGAIDLVNDAGRASAREVHETVMALLHSNWAAVATTAAWQEAVLSGIPLSRGNLLDSAQRGRADFAR
ncbi:isochorismatase family protein [Microbacterium koreense]|uniref:Isochorismatase family protein n=1 Tax=Microbacterium koreense TaxID=323761 RepID=A0ABW2ZNV9_9MICO